MIQTNEEKTTEEIKPKFELGQVVMTRGMDNALEGLVPKEDFASEAMWMFEKAAVKDVFIRATLKKHSTGDWGDCCEEDKALNDEAVKIGNRLVSVYHLPDKHRTKCYVITEWDRSVTTLLLPEEY